MDNVPEVAGYYDELPSPDWFPAAFDGSWNLNATKECNQTPPYPALLRKAPLFRQQC